MIRGAGFTDRPQRGRLPTYTCRRCRYSVTDLSCINIRLACARCGATGADLKPLGEDGTSPLSAWAAEPFDGWGNISGSEARILYEVIVGQAMPQDMSFVEAAETAMVINRDACVIVLNHIRQAAIAGEERSKP